MVTIDSMLRATKEAPSVWLEYVSTKKSLDNDSYLFCFFEGEDRKYYTERIKEQLSDTKVMNNVCGNRDAVIAVYEKILSENDDMSSLLFFIDRDYNFNSYKNNEFIYQTPEYSIENFYCKPIAIKELMEIEFGVQPNSKDMIFILELFEKSFGDFKDYYSSVNIWYKTCIKVGLPVQIEKFKPKKDIEFSNYNLLTLNNSITINSITDYYKSLLETDVERERKYAEENLNQYMLYLNSIRSGLDEVVLEYDREKDFRGKFALDFLRMFIRYIKRLNSSGYFEKKYKQVYIDEESPNLLSHLSRYAVTPTCLIEYINKHRPFIKMETHLNNQLNVF